MVDLGKQMVSCLYKRIRLGLPERTPRWAVSATTLRIDSVRS